MRDGLWVAWKDVGCIICALVDKLKKFFEVTTVSKYLGTTLTIQIIIHK